MLELTADRRHTTSVFEAILPDTEARIFAFRIGDRIGIRLYGVGQATAGFEEQVLEFAYSPTRFGRRAWLSCPGVIGNTCSARVMKLYLPYNANRFACAECHGLTRGKGRFMYRDGERLTAWPISWRPPSLARPS